MSLLQPFVNQSVLVLTSDGRVLVGTLRGTDQSANVILERCHERVFSPDGTEENQLGLYLIRGDSMYVQGHAIVLATTRNSNFAFCFIV
ncbi:hypothetical protein BCR43DRAFT_491038 [Syncephalastrum racemosum]|uniref:LSM2-LSM8 complex subunit LSM8 n=1 Tax=Syncephalastrum racemosum TaxID=13706 RepID=A0A1X2HH54_SYNRA|nr:hypothetical protein BCR43DRAFT_491038 [Syncephalastrum racemosum]